MRHLTEIPTATEGLYSELEKELERLKELTQQITPKDVLHSIDAAIAASPITGIAYSVTVSCHGSTDAGTT